MQQYIVKSVRAMSLAYKSSLPPEEVSPHLPSQPFVPFHDQWYVDDAIAAEDSAAWVDLHIGKLAVQAQTRLCNKDDTPPAPEQNDTPPAPKRRRMSCTQTNSPCHPRADEIAQPAEEIAQPPEEIPQEDEVAQADEQENCEETSEEESL